MEEVLVECQGFASAYIDDIVVCTESCRALINVEKVFEALRKASIMTKATKCAWGRRYLIYLGNMIGNGRLAIPKARITEIENFEIPKKEGVTNLSRRYQVVSADDRFVLCTDAKSRE